MAPAAEAAGVRSFEGRALGSPLRLHVDSGPGTRSGLDAGALAWEEVRAEFDAVDRALSRFRVDSELTALNRRAGQGGVAIVSWRLRTAVALMARAARVTGGRFDPTFVAELEWLGEHGADLGPGDAATAPPLDTAGLERPRRIEVPTIPLDTGGIGKGLALRWAAARLARLRAGDGAILLEAGGDIIAGGRATRPWRVGVEDPVAEPGDGAEPVAVIELDHGAVATSSVAVRRWLAPDGRQVHHMLDPRTREPARTGVLAVTVAGPDPAWAEVWTKALFLAGRSGIRDEARARGLAAWWVDADGALGMTPAARAQSIWVAEDRVG